MPFTIRDYEAKDFDTLWRIDQTCFAPGISYSRSELRFYMRRPASFTLVAVEENSGENKISDSSESATVPIDSSDGAIGGFIVAEAGSRARGHVITIDVVGTARRSGVGSLLLRAAEDRLIMAECRLVELETAVDNEAAISFYKRHGYSIIRTFPRYYSNGLDAFAFEKKLV